MNFSVTECRICLQSSSNGMVTLTDTSPDSMVTYSYIYLYVSGFSPTDQGPQVLCKICCKNLSISYEMKKTIQRNERNFNDLADIKVESSENVSFVDIKPEFFLEAEQFKEDFDEEMDSHTADGSLSDDDTKNNVKTIPDKVIQCEYCPYTCTIRRNLHRHCVRMHDNDRFKCPECSQSFRLRKQRDAHRRDMHRIDVGDSPKKYRKAQCPFCPQTFLKYPALYAHCDEMHSEQKLPCPDCTETFCTEHRLRKHRKTVHGYKPTNSATSICCHCGKIMTVLGLDAHIKNVHLRPSIEYTCDICDVRIQTKSGIRSHMQQKHLCSIYPCRHCELKFPNYGMRKTHEVRFHTFVLKHNCHICDKRFITGAELRKHLVTHTGDRQYSCDICGQHFTRPSTLKSHFASHSDARPFACKICSAAFKTKSAVRVHNRVHSEKNYECPVCDNKYFSNQQLRQHVEKIHPEYELPPKGTIMHKKAVLMISETNAKYNLNSVTFSMINKPKSKT